MYDIERPSARQIARGTRWIVGGVALAIIVAMLIGSMWIFGWGFFQRATADFRGETAELEQVKADPAHRISAREYFFQTCAAVQSHEDTITLLEAELEGDPDADRKEQVQVAITANAVARARLINEYNARADNFTFEQFRDASLPAELDSKAENTECTS